MRDSGSGGGSTPGVGTGDRGEAWSLRGTMVAKESESTSPSAKLPLSSLTLPHLTGMSVGHRLKAAASALKKPVRKTEGSTIAASKESGSSKKDDLEGHAAAGKKEAGVLQHLTAGVCCGMPCQCTHLVYFFFRVFFMSGCSPPAPPP